VTVTLTSTYGEAATATYGEAATATYTYSV
jgi:hypothetical protein